MFVNVQLSPPCELTCKTSSALKRAKLQHQSPFLRRVRACVGMQPSTSYKQNVHILQSAGHTSTPHVIFPIEILRSASIAWHELVEGTPRASSKSLNCPQVAERSSNQVFEYELQSSSEKGTVGARVGVDDGLGLIVGSKLVGLDDGGGVSGH